MNFNPNRTFQFMAFIFITCCLTTTVLGADSYLTSESLVKPRAEISLEDNSLCVFNQRGCVSLGDWTVYSAKMVRFPQPGCHLAIKPLHPHGHLSSVS